jgi:uncharacterized membrane-anchored protein
MKFKIFLGVLLLQTAWILGTSFVQERGLASGTVVLLETQPVDPRDLLRGDFVTLNYKISDVPFTAFSPPQTNALPPGPTVYVALEPRGDFYEVASASTDSLLPTTGQVIIRGTSQAAWWSQSQVHLAYGLERFFVREGAGNVRGKMTVQAAIPASGRAQIKNVFVDGKPFAEAAKIAGP